MKVGELAKNLNVTSDTVRYYTRIGLLKPNISDTNSYRQYTYLDRKRLHFILNARYLGFSIKDIQEILNESTKGVSSCPVVRKLIKKRLEETERQFQQMLTLRKRMKSAIKLWSDKPDKAPTSEMVCYLIEDFSQTLIEEK